MFKDQKVLVTGGSGMIGAQLVTLLNEKGAKVYIADLNPPPSDVKCERYFHVDLKEYKACRNICEEMDYVFNLVGIKASPKACMEKPADIMGPMMQFNTNMLEAAMKANVKWYLYTSTVGVYTPAEVLHEDDVWKGFPSPNDWYGGWAKRMGELQCQAYEKQYGEGKCSIVRPANVYGVYDNFNLETAMVIPSLIRKGYENEVLEVWGDGSQIRDFIHAHDVARGMLFAVENKITEPVNLGSGTGVSIKEIVDIISKYFNKPVEWDTTKPTGDLKRIFSTDRIKSYGFENTISLERGIETTIDWFVENQVQATNKKYTI
jgi:GDP-L-fucose synthase